jgi:caffeoyl-CoA O-methyltransferase
LITCEIDSKQAENARRYFVESPCRDRIDLRIGPALETIRAIQDPIGLAFIDGEKSEYFEYYEAVLERLAPRGMIVVDNTLFLGSILLDDEQASALHLVFQTRRRAILDFNRRVQNDPRTQNCLLTVSDGLTLISRNTDR